MYIHVLTISVTPPRLAKSGIFVRYFENVKMSEFR